MDEAIAMRVPVQFRDLAHALKGSAGSVGARRLHDLCDRACRINDRDFADIAPTAVSEIQAMFHDTRSALEGYLRERKNQVSQS
ncbi:MAG: Hpt domain-containing protein, partial [Sedimenticolaceae bacterium]